MKKFSLVFIIVWMVSGMIGIIFGMRKQLKKEENEERNFSSMNHSKGVDINFWKTGQPVGKA